MKSRSRNIMIAVFTIPAMIAIALVFVYPVVRTILMSFFTIDNVVSKMSEWSFVGVSNCTQLLGTPLFRQTWVTFAKIWVFGGLVIMCIAMLFAVILTSGVRGKSFWRAAIYLPNIISAVALANMWIHATLSRTFEAAAAVDGCTPIKTFFRIMLPLAQPGIITVGIFLFVNIWNEFFVAMIFATSSEVRPLAYGLYSLIQAMSTNGKWAELFASVMIVVVPTFILYLFLSEKIIAGVTGGGIKE